MCPNLWLVVYTVCTINYKSGCTQLQCCINCFFFFFFETPRSFRSIVPHRSLVALVCVMIIIFKNNNTIFFFFFSGKNFIAVFPVLFSAEDRLQGRGERAPRTGHGSGGFPAVRVSLPGPPAQDVGGETPRQDEPGLRLPPTSSSASASLHSPVSVVSLKPPVSPSRPACWSSIRSSTPAPVRRARKSSSCWTHPSPWRENLWGWLRGSPCRFSRRWTPASESTSFCLAQVRLLVLVPS